MENHALLLCLSLLVYSAKQLTALAVTARQAPLICSLLSRNQALLPVLPFTCFVITRAKRLLLSLGFHRCLIRFSWNIRNSTLGFWHKTENCRWLSSQMFKPFQPCYGKSLSKFCCFLDIKLFLKKLDIYSRRLGDFFSEGNQMAAWGFQGLKVNFTATLQMEGWFLFLFPPLLWERGQDFNCSRLRYTSLRFLIPLELNVLFLTLHKCVCKAFSKISTKQWYSYCLMVPKTTLDKRLEKITENKLKNLLNCVRGTKYPQNCIIPEHA